MNPSPLWIEQCGAARRIAADFGTDKALAYLVGEKFINFLEEADTDGELRAAIPGFVAEIKDIFAPDQIAAYLDVARQSERFDPTLYDDPEEAEVERRRELRQSASELLLVERAREWLLEE